MPPYLSDHFRAIDPAYQDGYKAGFEAAQRMAIRTLKEATKKIEKDEPFKTYTATTSTH